MKRTLLLASCPDTATQYMRYLPPLTADGAHSTGSCGEPQLWPIHTHTHLSMSQPTLQYNTNKFVTRSTCQFASEIWSAEMAPKQLRPHSIILASCKPGCKLWACRKHVASRSKACRKQVESQLQTCLKPSDDRTSRLMQQVREQVFDKKKSKACRNHVANPNELVENLAANLVESQVCSLLE